MKKNQSSLWFLWLYSHMACKVYERYEESGISESVFWDTFQDIRLWCENAEKEFGILGLMEYEWFYRHIDMVLFRFGRLQFEKMTGEESLLPIIHNIEENYPVVSHGKIDVEKVIFIHIPQGEPLIWEECEKSLEKAKKFFGNDMTYVCHSWLLYPGLDAVLNETSNIREFRKHFKIIQTDYKEREAEWRVFGKVLKNVVDYPEETGLQKRVKEHLLKGNVLGNGLGILVM